MAAGGCFYLLCKPECFALGAGNNHAAECKQRDHVWNDHELVEHVRKLPDEVIGQAGAEEDKHDCNSRINLAGSRLAAKQEVDIDAAEEVPADDRRERKKQQADGDYNSCRRWSRKPHRRPAEPCWSWRHRLTAPEARMPLPA